MKAGGLLCALVAAAVLAGCGGGGFNPDPVFSVGPISGSASHQIARLDNVASTLAGKHTIVNCWSDERWAQLQAWEGSHDFTLAVDASGITHIESRQIELAPYVCQILEQVLDRTAHQPLFTAWAVTVLAHESAHASGIQAENKAECRAITTVPRAAELLGIPKPLARRLQQIYRGTVYPHDLPRYRLPPCDVGLPGAVVPDTLGTAANLRPLARVGRTFACSLPHWKSTGGGLSVGPLSPCAPISSRTEELARFGEGFVGPRGASVLFQDATVKNERDFSVALARYKTHARCSLNLFRTHLREIHSHGRASLQALPAQVTRLSPRVKGFRIRVSDGPIQVNEDLILILDPAKRGFPAISFQFQAGDLPVSVEAAAVKAVLHSA